MRGKVIGRRRFIQWAVGATSGALLAACQPRVVKEIVKETEVVEKPVEKIVKETVVVEPTGQKNAFGYVEWHPDHPVELEWWAHNISDTAGPGANDRRILEGFHSMYPNIRVWVNPASWAAGINPVEKVAAAFAAGSGTPDLLIFHGGSDLCVDNGWVYPVSEEMMPTEDRKRLGYVEKRLLETKGDDRVTEINSVMHCMLMFYHVDLMEEAGLTADDLGEYLEDAIPALKELTKVDKDGTILQTGWSLRPDRFTSLVAQAGGQIFNKETGKLEWSENDGFMYAAQLYRDLHQVHKIMSADMPWNANLLPQRLAATSTNLSWLNRWFRVNTPDCNSRTRPILKLKPGVKKGARGRTYSVGIGVAANIKDTVRERAAFEFWKYVYYNVSNQADLAYENNSLMILKGAPDYAKNAEGIPPTGSLDTGQRIWESLYVAYEEHKNLDDWPDNGQLDNLVKYWKPMMEELAATDRPLKEVVKQYEDQAQADWDENKWWVPGYVAV